MAKYKAYIDSIEQIYKTSYELNTVLSIKPIAEFTSLETTSSSTTECRYYSAKVELVKPDGTSEIIMETSLTGITNPTELQAVDKKLDSMGFYTLRYTGSNALWSLDGSFAPRIQNYSFYYNISVVENKLPLKKWSVTDVVNRLCDLAEPIRKGEAPRFRFNGMRKDGTIITPENKKEGEEVGQAYKFDKVLSPQFSFTKETLRECLQEVGNFIHGEMFLIPKKDEDGVWFYEVNYEMYASQEESGIWTRPYIDKTVSQGVMQYTSYLDSNAENLVNQLDKYSGVIVEPYREGAQTVRTENAYVRIEDSNMLIATRYPIYTIDKLEYVYTDEGELKSVDITPWLFEKSVYDSQLSSYAEQYPYSKAYGLYYTQGGKNIGGLNFHVDAAAAGVFKEYAIVNILRQATGDSGLFPFEIGSDEAKQQFPKMSFRVTYTPFYNARVAQTKSYYKDFIRPAALIYNQQANVIESRYYGENLKGAIARLGNIDKSLTYIIYNVNFIPKAGQMFDKDYYISAVAAEMYPTGFLVTIGLSKDFNRISSYIGVNSEKRYSEISQTQAVERNTLYREYMVVGTQETPDTDCLIGNNLLAMIADTFTQTGDYKPLTNVCAWGTSYQGNDIPGENTAINLPVISSAFGNSISFSWQYEDNYSAGPSVSYRESGNVTGYFQNSQPYTDYYGRLYYYNFDLQAAGPQITADNLTQTGLELPKGAKPTQSSGYVSTVGQQPYVMRKDNREALQVNYQIDFVTNLKNFIIGSALASYCPAVRGNDKTLAAKLYVFPTTLNKFTDHVEAYETDVKLSDLPSADITVDVQDGYFTVNAAAFPADGASWAIVTKQEVLPPVQVEDEFGNVTEQQDVTGGDLLIGQNIEVKSGQEFAPIYFTKRREIFDKTVWKDRI